MNKRWWITVVVIIVALIVIGVLYENGMLDFKWQGLTMLFAALAGPYSLVKNWLTRNQVIQDIAQKHNNIRAEEKIHRVETDTKIEEKEKRIKELNKEIELSEKRIEVIELKKQKVDKEVKKMSVEELQDEAINQFGS